jgi:hypothetical protein
MTESYVICPMVFSMLYYLHALASQFDHVESFAPSCPFARLIFNRIVPPLRQAMQRRLYRSAAAV